MAKAKQPLADPLDAFCKDTEAYLDGKPGGSLAGLTFAAKDIFDVEGHVTGGGNPDWKFMAVHPIHKYRRRALVILIRVA